jgi:adenylate cyclase, class 2
VYVEIEAKLKVTSLAEVERRLSECGASFGGHHVQVDCYFDTGDRRLTRTDCCLRLRTERTDDRERVILTYKGPKQADDFKKREEVNLTMTDAEAAERLLRGLGFQRALVFDKRRSTWDLNGCEVALDELPLVGSFVEIEGSDSVSIARVREMLGLTAAPQVAESYACLIDRALNQGVATAREVFL